MLTDATRELVKNVTKKGPKVLWHDRDDPITLNKDRGGEPSTTQMANA